MKRVSVGVETILERGLGRIRFRAVIIYGVINRGMRGRDFGAFGDE